MHGLHLQHAILYYAMLCDRSQVSTGSALSICLGIPVTACGLASFPGSKIIHATDRARSWSWFLIHAESSPLALPASVDYQYCQVVTGSSRAQAGK